MDLILIRHGETAWNAERRLQGHTDVGLNAEGERQAAALGRALAQETIDVIVSSDLQRAHATAQAIAQHHDLPVVRDEALRERCYGAFEGLRYEEIEARYPQEYAAWRRHEVDSVIPPGERAGESFRQFNERILAALRRQYTLYGSQRVVIVSHGGVLDCAWRAATGMDLGTPRKFSARNASISFFDFDGARLCLRGLG